LALALSTSEEERRTSLNIHSDYSISKFAHLRESGNCAAKGHEAQRNADAFSFLMSASTKSVEVFAKVGKRGKANKQYV